MSTMKIKVIIKTSFLVGALSLLSPLLLAQEHSGHDAMNQEKEDEEEMDHSKMGHESEPAAEETTEAPKQHSSGATGTMASEMNMERNVSNTRDPHAHSGGYTLTEGPYALKGPRQLKLADEHVFKSLLANRFEYDSEASLYDVQAWVGTTYDRLVVKAEGDIDRGTLKESQTDILWSHATSTFWDTQIGVRVDSAEEGESRQWLAVGVQGLAPYWFELDVVGYVDVDGRTALAVEAEYELMLTQRLILQPRAEITGYGKDDEFNGVGQGLSSSAFGVRLRYEFSRQFAPYVGVERTKMFGNTADFVRSAGEASSETRYIAGLRFWL
ncbi:copper resistance protein B [Marinagarivorans cellulosilyticus]|uniref:Copper resistance protein B n=1 Tax=Marinagarivorans cellulosilyticus TaxID=2721545 RepID=A0AAN1WJD6_9GAMM|nr:copper resistance protein B [Marinagarivorans cellulosilyticus]BCD98695.1 copper resistance protein B [Marinagarivorans cellulosilyticus]